MMDSKTIDSHWNFGDPAASEAAFRELLEDVSLRPDVRAQITTQVVRSLGLQRKFDEGHELLDEMNLQGASQLTLARVALERGRLYNSNRELEQARPFFEKALELADRAGEEFYAIDAAHMLGIANPPEKQLEWSLEALRLAEAAESERARGWLGSLYNNIGWSLHELGRHHEALEMFEKGLEWRMEAGKEPGLRIAKWTVARQLRELGRVADALAAQMAILSEYGDEVSAYVYEELGECWFALDDREKAAPFFAKAYEAFIEDDWMLANEPDRVERANILSAGA